MNEEKNKQEIIPAPEIPDFTLTVQCGRGGTGIVWLGIDRDGIKRAVRILSCRNSRELAIAEADIRSFALYRQKTGSRRHQHLVEILYHGETNHCVYYVSELADNISTIPGAYVPDTLASRMKTRVFHPQEIVEIMLQILSAVDFMHKCGLAHHDLKPENIIFINGVLKITDLGLAGDIREVFVSGTSEFMPGHPCSGKECDIFAVGMILYCLYTGNSPQLFPELPAEINRTGICELNRIALGCCNDPVSKYKSIRQIRKEFLRLQMPQDVPSFWHRIMGKLRKYLGKNKISA